MRHQEIKDQLGDFAAGRLDEATRTEIQVHLDECQACTGWAATYSLYADVLGASADLPVEHPSSERLAEFVLEGRDATDGWMIARHLESCTSCRNDADLTRQALSQARSEAPNWAAITRPECSQGRAWPRYALAASLALALLAGGLWVSLSGEPAAESQQLARHLEDGPLEGVRVIESSGTMVATKTEIRPRADITLRSREAVVFGEGFSVGSEATLVVEIDRTN